ncbi:MAG: menaquinone biosynthesis protein [Candidatus Omnitrophica bacterium]|nr:menaquinone biosynthesis protein [Candidatus Omnitrophota bacterium]
MSIARVPYLNSVPFFRGLSLGRRYELVDCVPRELGIQAAAGDLMAGLLPLVDYVRLRDTFERIGHFGIAVRGRGRSVLLFSRRPIRQLDGSMISITEETSTSAVLLQLLLERRYGVLPALYQRGQRSEADALLLIGDEALRFRATNTQYPYEIDLAFEWWLWQHLPCVFAVWAIRKDADPEEKKHLETALSRSLAVNALRLELIAQEYSNTLGMSAADLHAYLSAFIYRLSQPEEEAIERFKGLADEHRLL